LKQADWRWPPDAQLTTHRGQHRHGGLAVAAGRQLTTHRGQHRHGGLVVAAGRQLRAADLHQRRRHVARHAPLIGCGRRDVTGSCSDVTDPA